MESYFSTTMRPDLQIIASETPPLPGQIVIGYMIHEPPKNKCLIQPDPAHLNMFGWISSVVLFFVFWPATCVPCCMRIFYDGYQIPVYGNHAS